MGVSDRLVFLENGKISQSRGDRSATSSTEKTKIKMVFVDANGSRPTSRKGPKMPPKGNIIGKLEAHLHNPEGPEESTRRSRMATDLQRFPERITPASAARPAH